MPVYCSLDHQFEESNMEEYLLRFWHDLVARIDGPMKFRIVLQPLVSIYFAFKAGKRDAKTASVPYFIGLISNKGNTKELLKQGWKDVGKVFVMAIVIDAAYQLIMIYGRGTQTEFYPIETIITSIALTFLPYVVFRGPVNRLLQRENKNKKS